MTSRAWIRPLKSGYWQWYVSHEADGWAMGTGHDEGDAERLTRDILTEWGRPSVPVERKPPLGKWAVSHG